MWRYTMLFPKFFHVDARIIIVILILLIHIAWWTFYLTVLSFIALAVMAARGLSVPAALRAVRAWFASDQRPGIPIHLKRRGAR